MHFSLFIGFLVLASGQASSWKEQGCSLRSQCPARNSGCYYWACRCIPGYYYSYYHDFCVSSCPAQDLRGTYMSYPHSGIKGHNIDDFSTGSSTTCAAKCTARRDCLTFEVSSDTCNLQDATALTDPGAYENFNSPSWTNYQRECDGTSVRHYRCPSLPHLAHGQRTCTGFRYDLSGSSCSTTCNFGYLPVGGPATITCGQGQSPQWSDTTRVCEAMCLWLEHHCWPGECANDLASNCVCRPGFKRQSGATSVCKLSEPPDLSTCRVSVSDASGVTKNSTYFGNKTNCDSQMDEWIRSQPTQLFFAIKADLTLNLTKRPFYVRDSAAGVVGANVKIVKVGLSGAEQVLLQTQLTGPPYCQASVSRDDPTVGNTIHDCEGSIDIMPRAQLQDGESLCADMEASSGGFYDLQDANSTSGGRHYYTPVSKSKRVCFMYDESKPVHCSESQSPCSSQPLELSARLTRAPEVTAHIEGWFDPTPAGGTEQSASQIEKYRIEVHGVDKNMSSLTVQDNARENFTIEWKASSTSRGGPYSVAVKLPEEGAARLYAIILEVHDTAGNVAYARRLVIYDNTSSVGIFPSSPHGLRVVSANPAANFRWQTDTSSQVCVDWKNHFHNDEHNDFILLPVATDTAREIYREYDQQSGILPISGTDNVQGVTNFQVTWSLDGSARSTPEHIPDVFLQTTCLNESLADGQTYEIWVKATDIMGNSKEDSVRVSIDHTGPAINIVGLRGRFERDGLYVHNTTDLSAMRLLMYAADPHSGLLTLQWTLGTGYLDDDVGTGAVGVQRLDNVTSCSGQDHCYCPSVGPCEIQQYLVTFGSLVKNLTHMGQHHRDYHLTITATNTAHLLTRQKLQIIIDESPPSVGVVLEGLPGDADQAEMDFTSSSQVHVHWHGFQDHESGVLMYRVALAPRCLTAPEIEAADNSTEVERDSATTLTFPFEGLYFTSIVAYNGAMQPSRAACSDGIVYDTTPPRFLNMSVIHARTVRSVFCSESGQPWMVNSNLTRVRLANASSCQNICENSSEVLSLDHFPVSSSHIIEEETSDELCRRLPSMAEDSYVSLPSDYLRMTWVGYDEESEMEEYYVGIGRDRSSASAPDLLPFTPTHGHPSYHARHSGLGHGDVFYIFLKAVSKAGLTVQIDLGPNIIDDTPPMVTQPLTAEIKDGFLSAVWTAGAFADSEQPADSEFEVMYRVGYTDAFITPFLSMPQGALDHCLNRSSTIVGCVRYPVSALHAHDTEQGRSFLFQLHVINAAGHVTTVNTSSVELPAHFPPSHGIVLDVLEVESHPPASSAATPVEMTTFPTTRSTQQEEEHEFTGDVDAFIQRDEMCVGWGGFHHASEISVEVGLGMAPGLDDVISFFPAEGQNPICLNTNSLPTYTKLFSVVRATSSGGTTVFSSDGFRMVPQDDPDNKVMVFNGRGCTSGDIVASDTATLSTTTLRPSTTLPVHPGDLFFVKFTPLIQNVTFQDAIVLQTTVEGYQVVAKSSSITIDLPSQIPGNTTVELMSCLKDAQTLSAPANKVTVTWEVTGPWSGSVKYFKAEFHDQTCLLTGPKKDKYKNLACRLAEGMVSPTERKVFFREIALFPGRTYVASISVCLDDGCFPPVTSTHVRYGDTPSVVEFEETAIKSADTDRIEGTFKASLSLPSSTSSAGQKVPCVYRWALTRDAVGSIPVAEWRVDESPSCLNIQGTSSIHFNGTSHGTLYLCIQPLVPVKLETPACSMLVRPAAVQHFDAYHVVELAHTTLRETELDEYIQSSQLGSKLHELYDLDIDFAKSDTMLSAVVTDSYGKDVTWFLLTSQRVPPGQSCTNDASCVVSKTTENGHVVFSREDSKLEDGKVYFICAIVGKEDQATEICGDGFAIDDTPPSPGVVKISNTGNGYLQDDGHVLVSWQGFRDIESQTDRLPDEVTISYSVALGNYPGGEDIAPFIQVGQRTTWTFEHLRLSSGTMCVATVRAEDRVGHITEAWSEAAIIDGTPPDVGHVTVGTITHEKYVPGRELPVHWEGVQDPESGIQALEVGIITAEGQEEVVPFSVYSHTPALITDTEGLVDGHSYIALLKVTNRAGLSTLAASSNFVVDSSPPAPGTVWNSDANSTDHKSYSTEIGVYRAYWSGFSDPHSGLDHYRVGLGTEPQQTDVHPFLYVGLQTSYVWRREFAQGTRYYITVEACNKAGLCRLTSSSSLTFDNSPPTKGHVTVGFGGQHSKYIGHNSSLPVRWTGFSDPQTGIAEFTWCVGTTAGGCNVAPPVHTVLSMTSVRSGITLPVATPLYVTVHARNPVGLETVSVSDSFVVDITPPEVVTAPEFLSPRDGKPVTSQRDRSILRLVWQFRDPDSSVVSQTVNVRSQLTGKLVADIRLLSTDTELLLPVPADKLLHDGDQYWTVVTACNAAGLCATSNSSLLLIDSTPPVLGTFESPLSWESKFASSAGKIVTFVNVSLRGFADAESGVDKYHFSAGRSYNGEDLSNGRVELSHDETSRSQKWTVELKDSLALGESVHFSVFAVNSLGLSSTVERMEFEVFFDDANGTAGSLTAVRHSCIASYCTGECSCAAEGTVCQSNPAQCNRMLLSHPSLTNFDLVQRIGSENEQQEYISSIKCLEGHWRLKDPSLISNILRFEWSFGLFNMSAGEGVFHIQNETVWHDAGRSLTATHCLPGNRALKSGQRYILHVRTWLSRDNHVTLTSPPVTVDHSPPDIKRGGRVTESDSSCGPDVDYITTASQITACWGGVFRDSQSPITKYEVWVGTSPFADDHIKKTDVGTNTSWSFSTHNLEQGAHYYVTVRAINIVGLSTTSTSDGFMIDVTRPLPGVVFSTQGHSHRHAQTSFTTLSASWHGFQDDQSGIASYHLALYDVTDDSNEVVPFVDVGFEAEYIFEGLGLQDKHSYHVMVKARDAAGLESEPVSSSPILIDTTPPEGIACNGYHLLERKNFENFPNPESFLENIYHAEFVAGELMKAQLAKIVIEASNLDLSSAVGYIGFEELKMPLFFKYAPSGSALAEHILVLPDSENKTLSVTITGNHWAKISAEFYVCNATVHSTEHSVTVHQMSEFEVSVCARIQDGESGIRSMMVGLGTTPGGLQVQPFKPVGHSGHTLVNTHLQHGLPVYATVLAENHAGQWSRFISQPITMDRTPPEVTEVKVTVSYEEDGQVNGTEIRAEWVAVDAESGIAICTCELHGQRSLEAQKLEPTNVNSGHCVWTLEDPRHGVSVHVKVSCVNNVQMHTTVESDDNIVLLRPPVLTEATLLSLPNNAMVSPFERPDPSLRSSNASLEFFMHGAFDPTINNLQYRFLHESRPLMEWATLASYQASVVLDRTDQAMLSGNVTAQVRASNSRQMTSDVVFATVQLDDSRPALTGRPATAVLKNGELELNWDDVFKLHHDATFAVYAGSGEGFGDVINHVITKSTSFKTVARSDLSEIYVTIVAAYSNGLSEIYEGELKM